jgi:hypothetical protein
MLNTRAAASLVFVFVSVLSACGGESRTPTSPTPSISGRWQGTLESGSDGPGTVTLQLTETGLQVAGALRLSQDGISDVAGTLTGTLATAALPTTMQYTVTYVYGAGCQGTFSGTFTMTGREMSGAYSGHNCVQEFVGTLHAVKTD